MGNGAKKGRLWGVAGLLLVDMIWGGSFVFMKNALDDIDVVALMAARFTLAAILLWLMLLAGRLKSDRNSWLAGVTLAIPLALAFYLQNSGLALSTAGNSALITGTYVVMIPLLSWFIIRRLHWGDAVIGLLTLFSLAIFTGNGGGGLGRGGWLLLGGAFFFAVHVLVLDYWAHRYHGLVLAAQQISWAALIFLIFQFATSGPLPLATFTPTVWRTLVFTAVFATALAYYVQSSAQRVLPPAAVSVLMVGEAPCGALAGLILLRESFTNNQIWGGLGLLLCMLATVWLSARRDKAQPVLACGKSQPMHPSQEQRHEESAPKDDKENRL